MQQIKILPLVVVVCVPATLRAQAPNPSPKQEQKAAMWSDSSPHKSGFVTANGIRINYLDWGGSGPALILIPGYGDNPHVFDELAPALTGRFHVVAYAQRAHGLSEDKAPYDTATLTEDLRGLMDGLSIKKAHLAGWSMAGNEITAMAGMHPERVDRLIYLDAAYDTGDPAFIAAFQAIPPIFLNPPESAMKSLDSYRAYVSTVALPGLRDIHPAEAYIRELVVAQPDGTVRLRMSEGTAQAVAATMLAERRDYSKVHSPALAIFTETFGDTHNGDPALRADVLAWEQKYMGSFRNASRERIQRELSHVEIVSVPGTHMDFLFTSRQQVVAAMRRFLGGSSSQK